MIHSFKRFLSLTLAAVLLIGLFPVLDMPVRAAATIGDATNIVDGLTASASGSGTWTFDNDNGIITGMTILGNTSTLTLTNTSGETKTLYFTCKVTTGSVTYDNGTYSCKVTPSSVIYYEGETCQVIYTTDTVNNPYPLYTTLIANGTPLTMRLAEGSVVALDGIAMSGGHKHPLNENLQPGDANYGEVTFQAWNSESSLPQTTGSYYLTRDVTLTETWQPAPGRVDLCLNGHKIDADHAYYPYFSIISITKDIPTDPNPILNLCDCNGDDKKHLVPNRYAGGSELVEITGGVITGGTGTPREANNGLCRTDPGADTVGGGVYIQMGKLNFYSGTIAGNTAQYGGGIFAYRNGTYSDTLEVLLDGTARVSYNATKPKAQYSPYGNGGGLCLMSWSTGVITGSAEISHNKAAQYGGGVGVGFKSTLTISGGSITGNHAPVGGGMALYGVQRESTVYLRSGSIEGNTAETHGAGIAVDWVNQQNNGGDPHLFYTDKLNIQGNPVVKNNKLTNNKTSNVFLISEGILNRQITIDGALHDSARIGVDRTDTKPFATAFTGGGAYNMTDTTTARDPSVFFPSDQGHQIAEPSGDNVRFTSAVDYTVEHYQQNLAGDGYALHETETLSAKSGSAVTAAAQTYAGFTYNSAAAGTDSHADVIAEGKAFKLYYDRDSYNVTYAYEGTKPAGAAAAPAATSAKYGQSVDVAPAPALAGYTFSGWTTADATVTGGSFAMPAKGVAFSGSWAPDVNTPYTVEHYKQNLNGSYPATDAETEDKTGTTGTDTAAAARSYEGFTAQTVAQQTIRADGSTVVKIYYTRNTHNVTYVYAAGSPAGVPALPPADLNARYGTQLTRKTAGTAPKGYAFGGWTSSPVVTMDGDSHFNMPDADITFTGTWTILNYTITYGGMEGASVSPANPGSYNVNSASITLNNPTRTGYDFTGWTWSGQATPTTAVTIPAGSTGERSYTANWTLNGYLISYDLDGGTVATANPTAYNVDTPAFTLTNPTRTGYDFTGWTWSGQATPTTAVTIPAGSTGNRTYTAHWAARTDTPYKVEYYQQNADDDGYTQVTADAVNGTGTTDTNVTATQKSYTNFHYNAEASNKSGSIAGDGSLVLRLYYDRDTYQVSYSYTGTVPTGAPAAPAAKSWRYGATVPLETPPMMDDHVLFSGWTPVPASGVTVTDGSFTMPAAPVAFTGEWKEGYSVRFHKADNTTVIENREAPLDTTISVTAPALTTGYTFWYCQGHAKVYAGALTITGIGESREYTEYRYLITFKNGSTVTELPSNGSVTMPVLDAGKVWRSNSGSFAEGGATVTVTGDTTFEVVDKINISSAAVGITDPVYGAAPVTTAAVSGEADFSAGPVVWKKQDGTILTGAQTFEAGVPYTATVTLTPKAGYQFASGTQITLNGRNVTPTVNADGTRTVSLSFTVPVIERTAWVWGSGYGSANVTVLYSTDTASHPDRETLSAAVTGPETDGDTATYRANATATKYGPQTVKTELSVTRSGERVTGVTVKTWINNTLKVSTALTVSGGVITEKGDGSFAVTGSGTLTTLEDGSQTLYGDSSGTLTADGSYWGNKGAAPGDNGDNGNNDNSDSSGSSDNDSSDNDSSSNGGGSAGSAAVAGAPYTGPSGGAPYTGFAFEDVLPGDWSYDAVAYVFENGWMTGVTETEFAPSDASTRAAVVEVLYRMAGSPTFAEAGTYTDVAAGSSYAGAVAWAQENGITRGVSSNLFRPEEAVTREQFVTFLYRYALYRSMNTEGRDDLSRYTDWETVSNYAENPMQWASDAGIIVGRSILLAPHEPATRAEIATMLARFCAIYALNAVSGPVQP